MQFDFLSMQNMYLSLARQDARPLARTLSSRPKINPDNQWAMFVRNHDELTLDKLSDAEREEVFAAFGPDPDMQMYGRGLRRRLPTMLGGDPARIRMVYSLMFSLPGTPVLFYGEEIGMGEDLRAKGRSAVRSPMQWDDTENGGFSTAPPGDLVAQLVDGPLRPGAHQRRGRETGSGLAVELHRHADPALPGMPRARLGQVRTHQAGLPAVLLHRCTWDGSTVIVAHNFGAEPASVTAAAASPEERGRRPGDPDGRAVRGVRTPGPCSGTCSAARTSRSPTTAASKSRWTATATGGSGSSARGNASSPEAAPQRPLDGAAGNRGAAEN